MSQLVQVYTDIYKPAFDENNDKYLDKSPYKPYERKCIRYECRCKAGAYFIGYSQFKQHIKSKTHKDFITNYTKYYKEVDELGETNKKLLSEKELLSRKNDHLHETNKSLITKIEKLQKQNKDLLKIIEGLNEDNEFEDCVDCVDYSI